MNADLVAPAPSLASRVIDETEQLVAISSPSGDVDGAERAVAACIEFLPETFAIERPECSTASCAPDLLAALPGTGSRRLLLLGHIDTVVAHSEHRPMSRDGGRLYGSGTADMKGGVALALAVARELAARRDEFAELSVLIVCDEEWRMSPFRHVDRFAGYDGCLCFEAGEVTPDGNDGVLVRRKGAGTLQVLAHGRASHSGAAPEQGRNALIALAQAAIAVAGTTDPDGPERMTVVPTILRSGEAVNVVPAAGELLVDMRSDDIASFQLPMAAVPAEVGGVRLEAKMVRLWPALDSEAVTRPVLARASELLGRRVVGCARGGASDASHLAPQIPVTIDGLGPVGAGAHTPEEFIDADSIAARAAVALAVAHAILTS